MSFERAMLTMVTLPFY